EVLPTSGTFRTVVTITGISSVGGMIIQNFDVNCFIGEVKVYELKTVFGFFPGEALANQVGLPTNDAHRALLNAPSDYFVDLTTRPAKYCGGMPRLANPMLLMLDRVTAYDPTGGRAGLGTLRGEKDVDPAEWFFKAHFFQDPVQPGSLGLEAILELLQFYMIERGLAEGVPNPRFQPLRTGVTHGWKYRGQVVPKNELISSTAEILEVGVDELGPYVVAEASLWVDGKRIYEASPIGMRIVPGEPSPDGDRESSEEEILDVAKDAWIGDHRPTFTVPALPMMSMLDRLTRASFPKSDAPERIEVTDLRVSRWLVVDGPTRTKVERSVDPQRNGVRARLLVHREARDARLSRFEPIAEGAFREGAPDPLPLGPLEGAKPESDPYASANLFHGPAFQMLRSLAFGRGGSSAVLDAGAGSVPRGLLHQGLLDAATHAIPHDRLALLGIEVAADQVAYPHRIDYARFYGRAPASGEVRCEVRFDGFDGGERFPAFRIQLAEGERIFVDMRLVEV
ncbi:MAG: polyketide synthase dehydratase domain-containing protein, partial [Polyangiaceae bacterium]|nr:polyketide synthase dehydratase domain-containing protein [Polyangiaceae bacterium]